MVADQSVGLFQVTSSSITKYPIESHFEVAQNNPVATSAHQTVPTVSPKATIGRGENTFMESTNANQTLIDNHNTNLKTTTQIATQNYDNQIPGEGGNSSESLNFQTKQLKEKAFTAPCVPQSKEKRNTQQ